MAFAELIDGLEVRAREITPPWEEASVFWQQWYFLEDLYAEGLDRDSGGWSPSREETELISRALAKLEVWLRAGR